MVHEPLVCLYLCNVNASWIALTHMPWKQLRTCKSSSAGALTVFDRKFLVITRQVISATWATDGYEIQVAMMPWSPHTWVPGSACPHDLAATGHPQYHPLFVVRHLRGLRGGARTSSVSLEQSFGQWVHQTADSNPNGSGPGNIHVR